MLSKLFRIRDFVTFAEGFILTEKICYKCWASCSSWERDLLLLLKEFFLLKRSITMLSKLFLMRKRFCYFCWRSYSYREICYKSLSKLFRMRKRFCYFCWRSYSYWKDLLQMLNKLFLMRKRFCYFLLKKFLVTCCSWVTCSFCYLLPFSVMYCWKEKYFTKKEHVWKLTRKCLNMVDECWSPHVSVAWQCDWFHDN